jgi:hypothetical protein
MRLHGIEDGEVKASQASEAAAKASVKRIPARWEAILAKAVGDAFGCVRVFAPGLHAGQ